jgi:hypothetical protein
MEACHTVYSVVHKWGKNGHSPSPIERRKEASKDEQWPKRLRAHRHHCQVVNQNEISCRRGGK